MERKELIELFKGVERANYPVCNGCPLKYTCDKNQITRCLLGTAADMLEADEQQIADLQKQVNEFIKNETHSSVIKAMSRRIAELEKELEIWTARSFEGKIASMAFKNLNLKMEISKLEAQLPKEGKWIRKEVKVYCPRDCWNPSACAIEGTWNEEEGWNLEMQDGFCSVCGEQDDQYYKDKYCPNCGARMKGDRNERNNC